MVKMTKKVQNYQIDQNGQKWSIWSKNWEKVREKKNKSIEARDDARA